MPSAAIGLRRLTSHLQRPGGPACSPAYLLVDPAANYIYDSRFIARATSFPHALARSAVMFVCPASGSVSVVGRRGSSRNTPNEGDLVFLAICLRRCTKNQRDRALFARGRRRITLSEWDDLEHRVAAQRGGVFSAPCLRSRSLSAEGIWWSRHLSAWKNTRGDLGYCATTWQPQGLTCSSRSARRTSTI